MNSDKKKGLGRGLSALFGDQSAEEKNDLNKISVSDLSRNPYQPRQFFDENKLEELSNSIKKNGVIQPIAVRSKKSEPGKYEIVAGERRWRAMQSIREDMIDAIVMDVTDKESALIAIVENVQREQLNAIEEAEALNKLNIEYNMTHDDIAKYTGKSRSHITNILRLNTLTQYVKSRLADGSIEMGHARAVLPLDATLQESIIKQAISRKLSVRAVEGLVRSFKTKPAKQTKDIDHDTVSLEKELSEYLAADIKINHNAAGTGKIEIKYKSLSELQGIVAKFKK